MSARIRIAAYVLVPLVVLALAVGAFVRGDPLQALLGEQPPAPPRLTVERVVLDDAGILAVVRAGGPEPVNIAQVQVDEAFWAFDETPSGPLARGQSARIRIPYHWVYGEPHELRFITGDGSTFDHEIEVAAATPVPDARRWTGLVLVGLFVGVFPVALGMAFYPALRRAGAHGLGFALALTAGLLAFLLVDTLLEANEVAAAAAELFEMPVLVWLLTIGTAALLLLIGRRGGTAPSGYALAGYLAFGIGVHNMGEGLAIGGAVAAGEAALGAFLVLGFTLHNVTEGIGIAAPLLRERVRWGRWIGLVALAGLPAVLGILLGSRAVAPQWTALCFAIGAGAILQVLIEVGALLWRSGGDPALRATLGGGALAGVAIMYATSLLVQI